MEAVLTSSEREMLTSGCKLLNPVSFKDFMEALSAHPQLAEELIRKMQLDEPFDQIGRLES